MLLPAPTYALDYYFVNLLLNHRLQHHIIEIDEIECKAKHIKYLMSSLYFALARYPDKLTITFSEHLERRLKTIIEKLSKETHHDLDFANFGEDDVELTTEESRALKRKHLIQITEKEYQKISHEASTKKRRMVMEPVEVNTDTRNLGI